MVEFEAMRSTLTGAQLAARTQEKIDHITGEIEAHQAQIAELVGKDQ